jgi:hypothetical protein
VVALFVDIDGIVDHHCLIFTFIKAYIIYVCDTRCTDEPVHAVTSIKQNI